MPTLIEVLANRAVAEAPAAPALGAIERRASKNRGRKRRLRSSIAVGIVIGLAVIAKPVFTPESSQTIAAGGSETETNSEGQAILGDRSELTNRFSPGLLPLPDNKLGASVLWPPEGKGLGRPDDVVTQFLGYLAPDLHADITIDESHFSIRSNSLSLDGDLVAVAGQWHIQTIDGIDGLADAARDGQFAVPDDWRPEAHIAVYLGGLHSLTVTSYPVPSVMGIPELPLSLSGEFSLLVLLYDLDGKLLKVAGASSLAWPVGDSEPGSTQSPSTTQLSERRPSVSLGECDVEVQVFNASTTAGLAGLTTDRISEAIASAAQLEGELLPPTNSDRVLEETVILVGPEATCFDLELLDIGRPFTRQVGSIRELFNEYDFKASESRFPDNSILIFMGRS